MKINAGTRLQELVGKKARRGVIVGVTDDTLMVNVEGKITYYPRQRGLSLMDSVVIDSTGLLQKSIVPVAVFDV